MSYENYRVSTFQGDLYNDAWKAAPPADLAVSAYAPPVTDYVPLAARTGTSGDAYDLDLRDILYLLRLQVICNFADGLILQGNGASAQRAFRVRLGLSKAGPVMNPVYGTLTVPIPAFNSWFEINQFVSDKALVDAAIKNGSLLPTDALTLAAQIFGLHPGGLAVYCTAQINPAIANLVPAPGAPTPGTAGVVFTLAAEIAHSWGEI